MDKNEVVLQLTLKLLENFNYATENFGGTSLKEHAEINAEIASRIFNGIYEKILTDE